MHRQIWHKKISYIPADVECSVVVSAGDGGDVECGGISW